MRDGKRSGRPHWDASRYAVAIRPIDRSDTEALQAFYGGLSSASRQRRFLGSSAAPSLHQCKLLAETLPGGFVAELRGSGPCDGDVIGHLSMESSAEGCEVLAVAVADQYQHRHIGSALLKAALQSARRRGVRELRGIFVLRNASLLGLLRHLPGARVQMMADGFAECSIALPASPA